MRKLHDPLREKNLFHKNVMNEEVHTLKSRDKITKQVYKPASFTSGGR